MGRSLRPAREPARPGPRRPARARRLIAAAAIAPHGDLAFADGKTHDALVAVGRRFAAARAETTIVVTPHNVHVDGHFAVVTAGNSVGEFAGNGLEAPTDRDLARAALEVFHIEGIPALGVSYGGNDVREATMPLDWGALVPLWFVPRTPVVVVSPARDRSWAEHVRAGAALAGATGRRRIALIASADHGHAHDPDGPYGFDPAAAEYDERIVEFVESNRLDRLLYLEPSLVERAKADSLWQLLMLHGALDDGYDAELLSYETPTYYGMITAAYTPARPTTP